MRRQIFIILTVLHAVSGQKYEVHQSPFDLLSSAGEYRELHSLICLTGCAPGGKNVHQTPPHLVKNKQESADLHCSHSIQDYQVMLWYKQSENKLHLLGYLNTQFKYPEEALKNKTDLGGDGRNNGTLTVKNLQPNDSAVYFCAVRYTVLHITVPFNKNPPPSELH
ncbi:hypothetical protein AOLI_G00120050 [Acnodon oligacanthus]